MIINVDVFFLLNLAVDFLLLWVAGTWCGEQVRPWRTLAAATAGALYAVLTLLPGLDFLLLLPVKLAMGGVMVLAAYGFAGWRRFLRLAGVLLAASVSAGGLALLIGAEGGAEQGLLGQSLFWLDRTNLTPALLVAMVLATGLGGRALLGLLTYRLQKRRQSLVAEVEVAGRTARLQTLVDTGHHLKDPLSGEPVLIADVPALSSLLPADMRRLFSQNRDPDAMSAIEELRHCEWATRLRLVPFRSLGCPGGLLVGFRTDRVTLWQSDRPVTTRPLIVALTAAPVDSQGQFQALCSPDCLPQT